MATSLMTFNVNTSYHEDPRTIEAVDAYHAAMQYLPTLQASRFSDSEEGSKPGKGFAIVALPISDGSPESNLLQSLAHGVFWAQWGSDGRARLDDQKHE